MDKKQFLELIQIGREGRNLEFKQSTPWIESEFKAKIVKSVLAFTNVRDGGWIIIGVEQQSDGTFKPVGVQPDHLAAYNGDDIASHVAEFADPYAKIPLCKIDLDSTSYVAIRVEEFDDIPVICKKDGFNKLRRGDIYTRTYRIPECAEVPSQTEMREILDMAIEKRLRKQLETLSRTGIPISSTPVSDDEEKFKSQRRDLISDE
jgi:predicted HTH transcriptional regulator